MATMKNLMLYPWGVLSTLIILLATSIEGNTDKNSKSDIITNLNYLKLEKNLQKINNPNLSRFLKEIGVNQVEKKETKMKPSEIGGNDAKILEILDDKKKLENLKANLLQARTALKEVKDFHKEWKGKVNIDGDGGKARDLSIKLEDMSHSVKELVKKYNYNNDQSGKNERKLTIQFNGQDYTLNQTATAENLSYLLNLINLVSLNPEQANLLKEKVIVRNDEIVEILYSLDFEEAINGCPPPFRSHRGHIISVNIIKNYLLNKLSQEDFDKNTFAQLSSEYIMLYDLQNYFFNYDKDILEKKAKVKEVNDLYDEIELKKTNLAEFKEGKIKELDILNFKFNNPLLNNYFKDQDIINAIEALDLIKKEGELIKTKAEDSDKHLQTIIKEIKKFLKNNRKKEINDIINNYECVIKFLTEKKLFDKESPCKETPVINFIFSAVLTFTSWNPGNIMIASPDHTRLGQEPYPKENIDTRVLIALKDENFNDLKEVIFGLNAQDKLDLENVNIRDIDTEIKKNETDIEKNKAEKGEETKIKELTESLEKLKNIKIIVDSIKEKKEDLVNQIKSAGLNQGLLEIGDFYDIWKRICIKSNSSFLTEKDLFGNTAESNTKTFWMKFEEENKCDLNYLAGN